MTKTVASIGQNSRTSFFATRNTSVCWINLFAAMPHVPSSQNAARRTLNLRMVADQAFNAIISKEPVRRCSTR
jgi:hypothetical protein